MFQPCFSQVLHGAAGASRGGSRFGFIRAQLLQLLQLAGGKSSLVPWLGTGLPYDWVNYNDLTATEDWKSWLVREIIPKWP